MLGGGAVIVVQLIKTWRAKAFGSFIQQAKIRCQMNRRPKVIAFVGVGFADDV